jgi:hypothetical protein
MAKSIHLIAISLLAFLACVHGLDMVGVKEGACVVPPVVDKADLAWMFTTGIKEFYSPMTSRYYIYKTAQEFLRKPMELVTEPELKSACLVNTAERTFGFGGRFLIADNKYEKNGVLESRYRDTDAFGTNYMTLTDKKSWVVIMGYWHDTNQKSWMVASSEKTLGEKDKKKILKHVASFGFAPVPHEVNYDACPAPGARPDAEEPKTEL